MSLINDALKRASESDKKRSAQSPSPLPMQPVASAPGNENSAALLIAAIIVSVLGIVIAGWLFLASRSVTPAVVVKAPAPPAAKPVAISPAPVPQPAPIVQKTLPQTVTTAAPAVIHSVQIPAPAPPVAPPETFPTNLTVNAIFYNKTNPRALVNGQTVGTGDKIGDVLVTGIMSDRVFVDWKGQSKVLMMGGQ